MNTSLEVILAGLMIALLVLLGITIIVDENKTKTFISEHNCQMVIPKQTESEDFLVMINAGNNVLVPSYITETKTLYQCDIGEKFL